MNWANLILCSLYNNKGAGGRGWTCVVNRRSRKRKVARWKGKHLLVELIMAESLAFYVFIWMGCWWCFYFFIRPCVEDEPTHFLLLSANKHPIFIPTGTNEYYSWLCFSAIRVLNNLIVLGMMFGSLLREYFMNYTLVASPFTARQGLELLARWNTQIWFNISLANASIRFESQANWPRDEKRMKRGR